MVNVKTANDLISDCMDAYFSGDEEMAGQYLEEAIERKVQDRFEDVLSTQPEFSAAEA
jgi:uncharacterized protein YbaP (TraB family)